MPLITRIREDPNSTLDRVLAKILTSTRSGPSDEIKRMGGIGL